MAAIDFSFVIQIDYVLHLFWIKTNKQIPITVLADRIILGVRYIIPWLEGSRIFPSVTSLFVHEFFLDILVL